MLVDEHLVVIGLELSGDQFGLRKLVEVLVVLEADGEGVDGTIRVLGHERDIGGGIDTAGEEDADRHVGHHAFFNSPGQSLTDATEVVLLTRWPIETSNILARNAASGNGVPVTCGTKLASLVDLQIMACRKLEHALEHGERCWCSQERQVVVHGHGVHVPLYHWVRNDSLDLRCEEEHTVLQRKVERFYPNVVTNEIKALFSAIPQRDAVVAF